MDIIRLTLVAYKANIVVINIHDADHSTKPGQRPPLL